MKQKYGKISCQGIQSLHQNDSKKQATHVHVYVAIKGYIYKEYFEWQANNLFIQGLVHNALSQY